MPDDRSWTERDYATGLLNSPAEIDVVTRLAIFGIESAYSFESPKVKRHVTTGNMLCHGIREQNMIWAAGRCSNACLNPILCGRGNVWSADSRIIATDKRNNEVVQPIGIRHAVRIGVRQDLTFGCTHSSVAGVT